MPFLGHERTVNFDVLLATVTGAAIAGVVGIATLLFGQWLADRRLLNDGVLAPAFNYVAELPRNWPWVGLGEPVWRELDRFRWLKIPAKFRRQFSELGTRIDAHAKLAARYWEFMRTNGDESFAASVRRALSKIVSADGSSIRGRGIGLDQDVTIQVQDIVNGVVPFVLMNPKAQARAWEQLDAVGPASYYWAKEAIRGLQDTDRPSLTILFDAVENNPDAVGARPLVQSTYESFGLVVQQANVVRDSLAARLRLKRALAT